ncbi:MULTISPECIES: D-aminoacyl-tRNA deacylase [Methanoculleus]|jgi:D-aminoacyl-tRNA deacylase|uniref:D-aminoacyl-tRNA deacylase n=1 Tax=Methanoculleus thermophilus TaxID=2200 RepID=A0A1G8Z8E4_9EURY|nr:MULTISPECIES: D-aminoacyl-tRNA deacylase [Methanoculleus]NLN08537.1 D-tyrosyl-tRNA(Tyr) deacylase [Methanoculleus thermophilus]SDK11366.1 D-aminoacyl-tRNA deacylase [Methanoculleus thermophilus]
MRIALINSKQDIAGVNIRDNLRTLLREGGPWPLADHELAFHEIDGRLIYQDRIDETIDADLIIFISRHSSVHPTPALTVHVTGNYETADLGGEPGMLAPAAPAWMHAVLQNLAARAPEGYRVSYEVTHHGPTALAIPSFFVEIGSTAAEWADPMAGRAVAESILSAAPLETINLLGFGGTHYAVRQTEIALSSRGAFGHIVPTRQIGAINPESIRRMQEASSAVAAYVDRKSLSSDEAGRIERLLDATNLPILSESEIIEASRLEWATYLAVRALAKDLAPGSRIHIHNLTGRGNPVPVPVIQELVEETVKSNKVEFLESLDKLKVAHISKGSKEVISTFIGFENESSQLARDITTLCVKLLLICEDAAIDGDHLVLRKVRFDPEKARRHGIPRGSLFAKLANGEAVEIGGRTITPDAVQTTSVKRIHIPGLEGYI